MKICSYFTTQARNSASFRTPWCVIVATQELFQTAPACSTMFIGTSNTSVSIIDDELWHEMWFLTFHGHKLILTHFQNTIISSPRHPRDVSAALSASIDVYRNSSEFCSCQIDPAMRPNVFWHSIDNDRQTRTPCSTITDVCEWCGNEFIRKISSTPAHSHSEQLCSCRIDWAMASWSLTMLSEHWCSK